MVRNPLASPDILGINNAAGLVAVSVLMFLPNLAFYWMPIFAFLGGVLSFVILWVVCGFNFRPIKNGNYWGRRFPHYGQPLVII